MTPHGLFEFRVMPFGLTKATVVCISMPGADSIDGWVSTQKLDMILW